MSARTDPATIGQLVGGLFRSRRSRTGQKVWRHSQHAGDFELRRWRETNMFSADEHNARLRAAEQFERATKLPGKRNGALGHIALDLLRFMLRLRNRKTGRLDPSLTWLAQQLRRSRSAIAEALARLKMHGFLEWLRRTEPVDNPEPGGQYVTQITNAYFFTMPAGVADLVRRMLRRPTEAMRRAAEQRARAAELASMTSEELIAQISDPELRETLERIRLEVDSANPPSGINETL